MMEANHHQTTEGAMHNGLRNANEETNAVLERMGVPLPQAPESLGMTEGPDPTPLDPPPDELDTDVPAWLVAAEKGELSEETLVDRMLEQIQTDPALFRRSWWSRALTVLTRCLPQALLKLADKLNAVIVPNRDIATPSIDDSHHPPAKSG